MTEAEAVLNGDNVQGLGLAGFRKDHHELLFVHFADAKRARRLLGHLAPNVASHNEVTAFNRLFSEIKQRRGEEGTIEASWLGLALTAKGLVELGVDLGGLGSTEGATAFADGMAARAQEIGDIREADSPAGWEHAFRPDAPEVHLLLILASDSGDDLARHVSAARARIEDADCEVVFSERGHTLPGKLAGHEHFGFKDGASQPAVVGVDPAPAKGDPPAIALGEFVLGYPDQNGQVATVPDTFKDGSFLVFRRLRQDVFAFRAQTQVQVPGTEPVLSAAQLAAKMVGRWPSGTPTETSPDEDPGDSGLTNAFAYASTDADGQRTPRFAHIRKVNPRDEVRPPSETEAVERRRMIRRGIPFGEPLPADASADDGRKRGLHFISIVSDVVRQFEFIQRQWVNDPNFPSGGAPAIEGGPYAPPSSGEAPDGPDPIVGQHDPGAQDALRQASGVHPFGLGAEIVNVTAGEYFFAPSLAIIGALATKH
jgi:Dyp-type peroxidase family